MKSYQYQRASSSGGTVNHQPHRLPWRDSLACWWSVMWLSICTTCRFGMRQGQA